MCAIGVVRVTNQRVVRRHYSLVRPPTSRFPFARLHGLTSAAVVDAPEFPGAWLAVQPLLLGVEFVCAHNAAFELTVLHACCARWALPEPRLRFVCTRSIAVAAWGEHCARLDQACRKLRIPLQHHDPLSDAEASARIMLAAQANGTSVNREAEGKTPNPASD